MEDERPPSMLNGKRNPAYTAWRKRQKEVEPEPDEPEAVASFTEVSRGEGSVIVNEDGSRTVTIGVDIYPDPFYDASAELEETGEEEPQDRPSDYIPSENDPEELAAELEELKQEEEILYLPVICEARNSKFVICAKDKRKVPVRLLKRGTARNFVKKTMKVRLDRKAYYQTP